MLTRRVGAVRLSARCYRSHTVGDPPRATRFLEYSHAFRGQHLASEQTRWGQAKRALIGGGLVSDTMMPWQEQFVYAISQCSNCGKDNYIHKINASSGARVDRSVQATKPCRLPAAAVRPPLPHRRRWRGKQGMALGWPKARCALLLHCRLGPYADTLYDLAWWKGRLLVTTDKQGKTWRSQQNALLW